jgi:hypothetical protein
MNDHTTVKVATIPDCDYCRWVGITTPAIVDGKTVYGPWAYMCEEHYNDNGCGLGLGRGQILELRP